MDEKVRNITGKLKKIIDENGPAYLLREPFSVYEALKESGQKEASLILYALVNVVPAFISHDADPVSLSKKIQSALSLSKRASDFLSHVFLLLYSDENELSWEKKNKEGLRLFMKEKLSCKWDGYAAWNGKYHVVLDCYYEAAIILKPAKDIVSDKGLMKMLEENPFTAKEDIAEYFRKSLRKYLDETFDWYCSAEDYYPPVCNDFEIDEYVSTWCDEHGFKLISCEGRGEEGDYL